MAGLKYVSDAQPGIRRRRRGKGFSYSTPAGEPVRDSVNLARIRALAIPPAWTNIWICPSSRGHIQATGRDARGRKQYRYHPDWQVQRDEVKFERLVAFAAALPRIRQRVEQDLARSGLPREKVLAAVVRLLETTLIRVGNGEYARQNGSFGLTTLRNEHADTTGATLHLTFRGKSGKEHRVKVSDRPLARLVRHCQELPGQTLFEYLDEHGECHSVDSADVNQYLRESSGADFTAKDFRTWGGTVLAAAALGRAAQLWPGTEPKHRLVEAIDEVARRLGNTRAVCRKSYIHPAVIDAYLDGSPPTSQRTANMHIPPGALGLEPAERAALTLVLAHQNANSGTERRTASSW
jgi:DNA topoisomerase-1